MPSNLAYDVQVAYMNGSRALFGIQVTRILPLRLAHRVQQQSDRFLQNISEVIFIFGMEESHLNSSLFPSHFE